LPSSKESEIPILIEFESAKAEGVLSRILSPRTVESIVGALPFTSRTFLWKEEIYFETPVSAGPEKPRSTVTPGTLAYWPHLGHSVYSLGIRSPTAPSTLLGNLYPLWRLCVGLSEGNGSP
jgi:hypothetical protein